jgi:hypothetical protein
MDFGLSRDSDTANLILKTRIRAQTIEKWLNIEIDHQIIAFIEPGRRFIMTGNGYVAEPPLGKSL